jgi:hypothetical protein
MPTVDAIFAGTITQSTASQVSKVLNSDADWVSIVLNVTAMSGAGAAAAFRIQWSLDGGTWAEASPPDAFAPITAPTCVVQRFTAKAKYWRAVCDLTGTSPSFTGSANSYS